MIIRLINTRLDIITFYFNNSGDMTRLHTTRARSATISRFQHFDSPYSM
jgi:hypothetical protein